jgi:SCY1-like protein 1
MHSFQTLPGFNGTPKIKGMQLGANKTATKLTLGGLPTELADEAAFAEDNPWTTPSSSSHLRDETGQSNTGHNPWGTDDLIDVNADENDWSAFESAPIKTPAKPSLSKDHGSSWMTDQGLRSFGTLNTTSMQVMTIQKVQSPALLPGTKSPQGGLGWDAVGTGEPPAEKAPNVPTGAPASQTIVSKEVKALEIARRKEERKQRIAMLKEQKKTTGKA